eukprot:CAMPEP_0119308820 /NCGR_PEP_ID=MMETSP1333-20130426/12786_1 /TAXON_ID=418940 /ORGANISM="Scyphosphaera apsteinii, Strain RCC1455" /LENGTH=337 /DNA_ID=CAMNT_0007312677 /DNA_START=161 /DNA_END=1174 /DNA_ORIENTATION=+
MAQRLEASLSAGEDQCVLGVDFFNATVHFQSNGACYQTTPGQHMGRSGFKAPGYRSVRRMLLPVSSGQGSELRVTVYGNRVHGEWRLVDLQEESEWTFDEAAPNACLLAADAAQQAPYPLRTWTAEDLRDLTPEGLATAVIVWQWCRGTIEVHGDLMRLGDEMWCPYMQLHNTSIEQAFASQEDQASIELETRSLQVMFNPGSTFARQVDAVNHKERAVRRAVKTVQELKAMHDAMVANDEQISGEDNTPFSLGNGETIPPEFYCPITQDLMTDPVCTEDGHTYERAAISQWFVAHITSPLTGLPLPNLTLRPNVGLRNQIESFLEAQQTIESHVLA